MKRPNIRQAFSKVNTVRRRFKTPIRRLRWPLAFAFIALGTWSVFVAAQLNLSINWTGTSVNSGATVTMAGPVAAGTICNASSGVYGSSLSSPWGSVTAGTLSQRFVCVQNSGTGNSQPIQLVVTGLNETLYGPITSPQNGQTIPAKSFLLVELDWSVLASAPVGSVPNFVTSV